MKFYSLTALLLIGSLLTTANANTTTFYKSVGKHGETRYTQLRPTDTQNFEVIEVRNDGRKTDVGQMAELPEPATPSPENDKIAELEKQLKEQQAQEIARRCQAMRANLNSLNSGRPVYETNAKGERVYLNDQEIGSKRQRTQESLDKNCKGI